MDQRHFESFYEEYFERIYKFVFYRVGGNRETARDLTQDVFLKAFEAFDRYDPSKGKSAWIYTIARNHVINTHAKSHPGTSLEDVEDALCASVDLRNNFMQNEDERHLMQALGKLSKDDAQLVRMKYLEGWTFEELSECLDKQSGALRVQATRALKKLRAELKNPYV